VKVKRSMTRRRSTEHGGPGAGVPNRRRWWSAPALRRFGIASDPAQQRRRTAALQEAGASTRAGAWVPLLVGLCLAFGLLSTRAADSLDLARCKLLLSCFTYIDWPQSGSGTEPWILGVVGAPPFSESLSNQVTTAHREKGRPVVIRICESPKEARDCHVLYVGLSDRRRVATLLEDLQDSTVWTVGQMDGFTKLGGIMNMFISGRRLRFEYSKTAYFRWRDHSKTEAAPEFLDVGDSVRE
jgi:hypothetical protein